jgi:hypothetical protein
LKNAIQDIGKQTTDPSAIKDLEEDLNTFTTTILNDPDKDKNLEAFEAAWQKNMRQVR